MANTHIIAKFLRTDLVNCSHFREGINLSYSRINMVSQSMRPLSIILDQCNIIQQFKVWRITSIYIFFQHFSKRETRFMTSCLPYLFGYKTGFPLCRMTENN